MHMFRRIGKLYILHCVFHLSNIQPIPRAVFKKHVLQGLQSDVYLVGVVVMDFLRFCPFSSVEGRVLRDGVPVPDAAIERCYSFDADRYAIDMTTTNINGYFKLGSIFRYSLVTLSAFELDVFQRIWIVSEGQKYEAWRLTKHRPLEVDSELPNAGQGARFDPNVRYDTNQKYLRRKIRLICDLGQPPSWKEPKFGRNQVYGVCSVVERL